MKIQQLLLTTDFSEEAQTAYPYARSISREFDAKIHLVHFAGVIPPVVSGLADDETFYDVYRQALTDEATLHPALRDVGVMTHLIGHRWRPDHLRSFELEHNIDLVVMGTHGRTGIRRHALGSFAERIVRNSSVPVLVCRLSDAEVGFQPKTILVPYDFSEVSEPLLPAIHLLSSHFQSRFRFVYVYEPVPEQGVPIVAVVRDFLKHARTKPIEKRFDELVDTDLQGVDASLETRQGIPHVEIVKHVRQIKADLVLIGTHGLLGSVAQNVTREASCAVLTVPSS